MKKHERPVQWLFYEHLWECVTWGWVGGQAIGRAFPSGQAETSVDGALRESRAQGGANVSLLWDQATELLSVEGPL